MQHRRFVQASPALIEMLSQDAEASGEDPFDAPPPGPVEKIEPLIPALIPPPDWRAEEAERAQREAAAANQDEREPEQPSYPAPKQPKAKTPNLDAVKKWRAVP